ncbi:hypothetical protein T12_11556 [Trichinella patagoniensis]|uniref:Uncharacterized protein n=1 Tax=Trichinella patagoniensis TaxID=990121 RepID=A0A0V0Z1I3_9BILA|nr:hypothetical protein T12_11556 [Trichinella patagoniensis]
MACLYSSLRAVERKIRSIKVNGLQSGLKCDSVEVKWGTCKYGIAEVKEALKANEYLGFGRCLREYANFYLPWGIA